MVTKKAIPDGAFANYQIASMLDAYVEAGGLLTGGNLEQALQAIARTDAFGDGQLLETMHTLRSIVETVEVLLRDMDAQDRMLTPAEMQFIVDRVSACMRAELMRLAVHVPSPKVFYFPLYEGPYLTLNLHAWREAGFTTIHDHGDAYVAIRMIRGHLTEEIYVDGNMYAVLRPHGQSYTFDDALIHKMGNPFRNQRYPVSLHAYSGPSGGLTCVTSFQRQTDGTLSVLRVWHKGDIKGTADCPCSLAMVCPKEAA